MNNKRLHYIFLISVFMFSIEVNAEPVQTKFQGLKVNANFIDMEDKSQPFFLILHGTWAWHGMELIEAAQEVLEEEQLGSLAITLSLGIDNRSGFLGCPAKLTAVHQKAYAELHHWYQYLSKQGYSNIILMSHSRGGSQASGFANAYPQDKLSRLVLLAPLAWDKDSVHKQYKKKTGQSLKDLLNKANGFINKQTLMKSVDVLYCKEQTVTAESFLSYYSENIERNTWDLIKDQKIVVDIFLGSEDAISTLFKHSIKNIKLPENITVQTIDGADHFFRDLYLEEIIELLLELD